MDKQQTLKDKFSLTGYGLHTGRMVTITFNPAPANHGYKIRRVDLPESPVIKALAHNVTNTDRGTTLCENGIIAGTVEHGMAALYASGIDNCMIDIDAPEFPIMDGSSALYIKAINETGIAEQDAERNYLEVNEEIEVESGSSKLKLLPDTHFNAEVKIKFPSSVLTEQCAVLNNLTEFTPGFAQCRTFVFVREIEELLKRGLIKGGSLNNAIVIYDTPIEQSVLDALADAMNAPRHPADKLGYILSRPLSFDNEPARHKLLDLIGDIALVGKRIKGCIVAECPGHKVNNIFARAISESLCRTKKES